MELEDVADPAPDAHQDPLRRPPQLLPQYLEASLLRRAERADQGEESRFARAGGPGQDDDLARLHLQRDAEENLLAERAAAEVMAHPVEVDERLGRHQKISAGSAARSLRIATAPDAAHMTAVKPRTRTPRSAVSCIGSMVADCVMA